MTTIGLAHRSHRDFVAEWGDADGATASAHELALAVDRSASRAGATATVERPRAIEPDLEAQRRTEAMEHDWPVGEPTF